MFKGGFRSVTTRATSKTSLLRDGNRNETSLFADQSSCNEKEAERREMLEKLKERLSNQPLIEKVAS
jgi:hypothetical protein